jgi:hypothetical protein
VEDHKRKRLEMEIKLKQKNCDEIENNNKQTKQ